MAKEEKILTLHPPGKNGVNILKRRYDIIGHFIIEALSRYDDMEFKELCALAEQKLATTFDGKIVWYMVVVKQDLEARGSIEQIAKISPQRVRLKK